MTLAKTVIAFSASFNCVGESIQEIPVDQGIHVFRQLREEEPITNIATATDNLHVALMTKPGMELEQLLAELWDTDCNQSGNDIVPFYN